MLGGALRGGPATSPQGQTEHGPSWTRAIPQAIRRRRPLSSSAASAASMSASTACRPRRGSFGERSCSMVSRCWLRGMSFRRVAAFSVRSSSAGSRSCIGAGLEAPYRATRAARPLTSNSSPFSARHLTGSPPRLDASERPNREIRRRYRTCRVLDRHVTAPAGRHHKSHSHGSSVGRKPQPAYINFENWVVARPCERGQTAELSEQRAIRDDELAPLFQRWPSLSRPELGQLRQLYAERLRIAKYLGRRRRSATNRRSHAG